ncbi:MAG: lactate utilization protein C [Verrucomicrobiales bacterium]
MSEARTEILKRIREALREPAERPHVFSGTGPHSSTDIESWLPAVPPTFEEQRELFSTNAAALQADFQYFASATAATSYLDGLRKRERWLLGVKHPDQLLGQLTGQLEVKWLEYPPTGKADMETCDVAFTRCNALIAQTGSVLLNSHEHGGRTISSLPPHHVVIARRCELLPDLPSAVRLIDPERASFYSFITGPSRTGDIERILVLGAHGPKKLTILLVEDLVA